MSQQPGADELRVRATLIKRGVGPDADPEPVVPPRPPVPPKPAGRPPDWLDKLLKDNATSTPAREPDDEDDEEPDEDGEQPDRPRAFEPQPDYWPRPHLPGALTKAPARAEAAISHGTRRLLYNATAAGTGWALGLYQPFADALADCGESSIGGTLVLGIGGTLLIAHVWDRRTRQWWPGIAWIARIPLATAILALALWAPAA